MYLLKISRMPIARLGSEYYIFLRASIRWVAVDMNVFLLYM